MTLTRLAGLGGIGGLLLATLVAGCALEAAEDDADVARDRDEELEEPAVYLARDEEELRDPCRKTTVHEVDGHAYELPVFCTPEDIDRGDPVPRELEGEQALVAQPEQ
jgi:hypothetical protein